MNPKIDTKREAKRIIFGLIGAVIMAVNIKTFVRAGGLYPGGFNGVTLLFQTICDRFFAIAVPFSPISLALNAIPAIISFKAIGKKFTVITSLMIVATSVLTDMVPAIPITQDILLISVFGGLINGVAISIARLAALPQEEPILLPFILRKRKTKMYGIIFYWQMQLCFWLRVICLAGTRRCILLFSSTPPHR